MRASRESRHISGAENITTTDNLETSLLDYLKRAQGHEKGPPDRIVFTLEALKTEPSLIPPLPVTTLECKNHTDALSCIKPVLRHLGISERGIDTSFEIIYNGETMRGASIMDSETGHRLEPDRKRGIRASRFGMTESVRRTLEQSLTNLGLNSQVVTEALTLASKVASAPGVMAELCVSDDPSYTTGYIGSQRLGYLRVPHIKESGSSAGGRVIFVNPSTDVNRLISYLEGSPVLVSTLPELRGIISLDEIIGSPDR